eukprot:757601-Rhodomonas_salina.1
MQSTSYPVQSVPQLRFVVFDSAVQPPRPSLCRARYPPTAILLRAPYAVSGTDTRGAAARMAAELRLRLDEVCPLSSYALGMQSPVLIYGMRLPPTRSECHVQS